MALELAQQEKACKKADFGKLLEGEVPTLQWLERCSGAIMMPRRPRPSDPWPEDLGEGAPTVEGRGRQHDRALGGVSGPPHPQGCV